jgi:citrate lyase beta subunit
MGSYCTAGYAIWENRAGHSSPAGAFNLDGRMIDMPLLKAAERVLARAQAAGI